VETAKMKETIILFQMVEAAKSGVTAYCGAYNAKLAGNLMCLHAAVLYNLLLARLSAKCIV